MPESADADLELKDRVDSGLYGVVWRGEQKSLRRTVAIKLIQPGQNAPAAAQHGESLARVDHPNVVRVFYISKVIDPESGQLLDCVVMEWLDGDVLWVALAGPRFSLEHGLKSCREVLDGLDAIHSAGIAHADLHAGNVIVTPKGAKVIDIRYADSDSLARLSTTRRDNLLSSDVEFARHLLMRVINHCDAQLDIYGQVEPRLRGATSTRDLRKILDEVDALSKKPRPILGVFAIEPDKSLPRMQVLGLDLSGEAAKLICEAAQSNGQIHVLRSMGGAVEVRAGNWLVNATGSPRTEATWTSAVKYLLNRGFIDEDVQQQGFSGYSLSSDGFTLADAINALLAGRGTG